MHSVQKLPGRMLQVLADEAGIHINTARDHMRVLEAEGLITSAPVTTGTRGRPPLAFYPVVHAASNPEAERRVHEAKAQGDMLRRIAPESDHTETLGDDAVHQLDTLYSHLDDVGLEPDVDEASLTIDLQPCPYTSMFDENQAVVCSVHANLVRDQLSQTEGPLRLDRLNPYVSEHQCVIALKHTGAAAADTEHPPTDGARANAARAIYVQPRGAASSSAVSSGAAPNGAASNSAASNSAVPSSTASSDAPPPKAHSVAASASKHACHHQCECSHEHEQPQP